MRLASGLTARRFSAAPEGPLGIERSAIRLGGSPTPPPVAGAATAAARARPAPALHRPLR